jgi:hypothetical protein
MTRILYTGTKPVKKVNRKPGWRETQRQYQEWLAKHRPTALTARPLKQVSTIVVDPARLVRPPSLGTGVGTAGRAYVDPRVQYKDDPELAERELAARQRKFTVAPLYNKGGDMLVTDETLKDIMSGATRRRN